MWRSFGPFSDVQTHQIICSICKVASTCTHAIADPCSETIDTVLNYKEHKYIPDWKWVEKSLISLKKIAHLAGQKSACKNAQTSRLLPECCKSFRPARHSSAHEYCRTAIVLPKIYVASDLNPLELCTWVL